LDSFEAADLPTGRLDAATCSKSGAANAARFRVGRWKAQSSRGEEEREGDGDLRL